MSPPELLELSSLMYSLAALFASEEWYVVSLERKTQGQRPATYCVVTREEWATHKG